jgi:hypothetical protein
MNFNPAASFDDINDIGNELIETENRKLERLENLHKETTQEKHKKDLEAEIDETKVHINDYLSRILEVNNTISSHKAGITVLDNYKTFSAGLIDNTETKMNEFIANSNKSRKGMTDEDRVKYLQFTEKVQKEFNKREGERNRLAFEIVELEEKRKGLKKHVKELEDKFADLKRKLDSVKSDLLYHYHKLLATGKDTREEGLTWLIKAIWNLDSTVTVSHLPKFLDEQLIEYLFKISHMDFQNERMHLELEQKKFTLKMRIQKSKTLKRRTVSNSHIFPTESNVIRIKTKKGGVMHRIIENRIVSDNLSIRQTFENLQNREPIDAETLKIVSRLEKAEALYNNHKKTMLALKRKELERVNREFLINNYERRFGVKLDDIVSVIVGEDHVKNEMERQYKDQKVI